MTKLEEIKELIKDRPVPSRIRPVMMRLEDVKWLIEEIERLQKALDWYEGIQKLNNELDL